MDLNKDVVKVVLDCGNVIEVVMFKELVVVCDIVMLCFIIFEVVEKIVYGDEGVLEGICEGVVLIDFGIFIFVLICKIGVDLVVKGVGMIDVFLGCMFVYVKDGFLNIMVVGDKVMFEKVKLVLDE